MGCPQWLLEHQGENCEFSGCSTCTFWGPMITAHDEFASKVSYGHKQGRSIVDLTPWETNCAFPNCGTCPPEKETCQFPGCSTCPRAVELKPSTAWTRHTGCAFPDCRSCPGGL